MTPEARRRTAKADLLGISGVVTKAAGGISSEEGPGAEERKALPQTAAMMGFEINTAHRGLPWL